MNRIDRIREWGALTLPNGREFVAHAPRDELKDIADEAFDE
jgi:hypothetical protein